MDKMWQQAANYGVIKESNNNYLVVYRNQHENTYIHVGQEIADYRWAGSAIIVRLKNGNIRRYYSFNQYHNV